MAKTVINSDHTLHRQKGKGLYAILNERFGFDSLNYEVPPHANTLLYTLGGITAISTVLTIISGIVLAQWYVPTPEEANSSIRYIMESVALGGIIRGIHYWSAQLTIVSIVLHLVRILLYGSYKAPREGNWIVGVLLFGTMIGLYFTGTALKWDQEGLEALEHSAAISDTLGFGAYFTPENIPIIMRLFTAHVSILPMLLLALIFIHVLLIKRLKISPLPWKQTETANVHQTKEKHTFSQHFRSLIGYGYIVLGITLILAVLQPPSIGPDAISGIEVTKPFWPFLWIYAIEEWFGINGALIGSAILFIALLAVPFLDRGSEQSLGKRKWLIIIASVVILALIIFTVYAYFSTPVVHLDM